MKKLMISVLLLTGCGIKMDHKVSGTVQVAIPTNFTGHVILDSSVFDKSCSAKYQSVGNDTDRNKQIDDCIIKNNAIVQQLVDTLNGTQPTK